MKNYPILILFLFNFKVTSNAQSTSGIVTYKSIIRIVDTVKMTFDNYRSISIANRGIKSVRKILGNGEVLNQSNKKEAMEQLERSSVTNSYSVTPYYTDEEGDVVFRNFKKDTIVVREVNHHDPVICQESPIPKIQWTIENDYKKIGSFDCQKAKAKFRGRKFTAWFAKSIPVPHGPWKLHGLPGLILEAYDEEKEMQYLFVSIEIPAKNTLVLNQKPATGTAVSVKEYYNVLQKSEEENVRSKMSKASARGVSISITAGTVFRKELEYEQ